jgi:UDP-GlcNAc:undecaprenyl-phosphate GlcNAc-1-phosphate transferase
MPGSDQTYALLLALVILFLFGVWDDISDINFRIKFIGQILAASVVVYWGDSGIHNFPFVADYSIDPFLAKLFTVILLVGVTNAVNMSDGLDGLAGGTSMLAIGCMTVTAYLANDSDIVVFGASLIGATLGFLRFNTYPARIFMGDTGSQILGFSAGLICILVTQQSNTALSSMMPILVLGLPLFDVFFVMARRIYEGRSPFSADRNHIHHRLLDIGFAHREAVFIIYTIQLLLVITAFLMRYATDLVLLGVYAAFCVALISIMTFARRFDETSSGWVVSSQILLQQIGLDSGLGKLRKFAYYLMRVLFSAILILGVMCIDNIPKDFGVFAILLLAILLPTFFIINQLTSAARRLGLYVTAGFVTYFMEVSQQGGSVLATYLPVLFLILAVVVLLLIRMAGSSVREFSSLDFLLLAMALIISMFPDAKVMDGVDAVLVIEIVVLFYAIDALFNRRERLEKTVLASAVFSLAVIAMKSFS